MKNGIKEKIYEKLDKAKAQNNALINSLKDRASLTDYGFLMKSDGEKELWADAFQAAIDEHEIVVIPARKKPYYIEKQNS